MPADPFHALDWVQLIVSAGAVLTSAEILGLWPEFSAEGFLGWPLMGRLVSRRRFPWPGRWMGNVMRRRGVMAVGVARLLAALWLLLPVRPEGAAGQAALLAVLLAGSLLLLQRLPYGMEGSDQLAAITFAGLLLARLFPGSERMALAVAWFLALQATLAYFTAGVVKIRDGGWRDGSMLRGVLTTVFYGHRGFAAGLRTTALSRTAIWAVIIFELAFPAVFFCPAPVVLGFLAAGLVFHVMLAVVMGLNYFVWTFAAIYPAIYCCAVR